MVVIVIHVFKFGIVIFFPIRFVHHHRRRGGVVGVDIIAFGVTATTATVTSACRSVTWWLLLFMLMLLLFHNATFISIVVFMIVKILVVDVDIVIIVVVGVGVGGDGGALPQWITMRRTAMPGRRRRGGTWSWIGTVTKSPRGSTSSTSVDIIIIPRHHLFWFRIIIVWMLWMAKRKRMTIRWTVAADGISWF